MSPAKRSSGGSASGGARPARKAPATGARRGAARTAPGGQGASPRTGGTRGGKSGAPRGVAAPKPAGARRNNSGPSASGAAPSRGGPGSRGGASASRGGAPSRSGSPGRNAAGSPSRGPGRRPTGNGPAKGMRGATPVRPAGESAKRSLGGEQVEGRHAVLELLLAGARRPREIIFAGDLDSAPILDDIIDLADELKVPLREISRSKFESMARTDAPQGVLAMAAPLREYDLDELMQPAADGSPAFLVLLDGVTDPGNLGALLRSAECAGVTGVILPRHRAAHITPTVTKSAQGAVERLRMATVPGIPTALRTLHDNGVWTVGLEAAADQSLFSLELATEPVALVLGSEGTGLSALTRKLCDALVSIPLRGRLNSLNVSVAGALACFEITRRREAVRQQ